MMMTGERKKRQLWNFTESLKKNSCVHFFDGAFLNGVETMKSTINPIQSAVADAQMTLLKSKSKTKKLETQIFEHYCLKNQELKMCNNYLDIYEKYSPGKKTRGIK